jgi:putative oxidoreductase
MMRKFLNPDVGLLVLRLGIALLMLPHGWQKIERFEQYASRLPAFAVVLSALAEIGCSLALLLGIQTRLATIPLIINMSVAAFLVKADAPWQEKELAVVYLLVYLTLFLAGGGKFSLQKTPTAA